VSIQYVFPVLTYGPSGLAPGHYCVWVWDTGESELMFKPLGSSLFGRAVKAEMIGEQP